MSHITDLIARAREIMEFNEDSQVIGDLARELEKAQPRIITTMEELDALPIGSCVRDSDSEPWERSDSGWQCWVYGDDAFPSISLSLPATVLFDPKEETK